MNAIAVVNAAYFASEPNVSTEKDSTCPGVRENSVWEASSGINNPPAMILKTAETTRATIQATRHSAKFLIIIFILLSP